MKLAAIDIGSNAVRMKVIRVTYFNQQPQFKKIEYLRFPLLLGGEVFESQFIGPESEQRLTQLLQAFKILLTLYEVDDYMICATASWREANNGLTVKANIEQALRLSINVIDGSEEAALISKAIQPFLKGGNYLHVEVGGGSTEISFYKEQTRAATRSFRLGSIRKHATPESEEVWADMEAWIYEQKRHYRDRLIGIATGGNIRKLAQIIGRNKKEILSVKRLVASQRYIASHSLAERINVLQLNPDRAESILPASEIYLAAMRWGEVKHTLVPDAGLRDGIIKKLYEKRVRSRGERS